MLVELVVQVEPLHPQVVIHTIPLQVLELSLPNQSFQGAINMAHFAKVVDGKVSQVIVAEPEFFQTFVDSSPGEWIQTSYNTHGGVHANGGTPLRKNYAGIGFTYDRTKDAFIPPQPFASWTLDDNTCLWNAPVAMPTDGKMYTWDEATTAWVEVPAQA
jgi:hypothetical protein